MRRKYGNRKVELDGYTFDSAGEANRYRELVLLHRAGEICKLKIQPVYMLQPAFKKNGVAHRSITYIADFEYFDVREGRYITEDFKGMETEVFKIKRKLFEKAYPDKELRVVRG